MILNHIIAQELQPTQTAPPEIIQFLAGIASPRPNISVPGYTGSAGVEETPGATAAGSSSGTLSPALDEQIIAIEQQLESLKNKPIEDLHDDLNSYATAAVESVTAALSAAHYAIVYAWATGCVLNMAKEKLGKGPFGRWRDAKSSALGICVRRAQMWMKMARDCSDVRALLVPGASLTGTYRAAGILPQPDTVPQDQEAGGDDPSSLPATPPPTERVFTALAEGRMRLRHLVESGRILDEKDRDRLAVEKSALITLFDTLLHPLVP